MQVDIIDVATSLAQSTNVQPSVAIVGAFSDMMRHLRKSIHCSIDDSDLGEEIVQWNKKFQASVNKCLVQLSHKVTYLHPPYLDYLFIFYILEMQGPSL